jgi:hypothetical protein
VGANVTLSEQLLSAATDVPHPLLTAKLPLALSPVMLPLRSPLFVTVIVCGAETLPIFVAANVSELGESCKFAGAWPVPANSSVCVPAESVTVNDPVAAPLAVGLNTSPTEHPVFPASDAPQVFDVMAKLPVTVKLFSEAVDWPVFSTSTSSTALDCPTGTPPNASVPDGEI